MSKYIDVDAFVENFRMTQLLLKVWAGSDLTPEQEIVIQSGEAIIKDLIKFPAADVAPVRRGRWIEEDGIQICSECGEEHEWEDYRAPYCDTCGAKMNKEEA